MSVFPLEVENPFFFFLHEIAKMLSRMDMVITSDTHFCFSLTFFDALLAQAYNCYVEALRIQPNFAIAWSNLAGLFMEAGDLNRALQYYKVTHPGPLACAFRVCVYSVLIM